MERRKSRAGVAALLCGLLCGSGCGTGTNQSPTGQYFQPNGTYQLSATQVDQIVKRAAASLNLPFTIAVSDRRGQVLAVYAKPGASATALANYNLIEPADEVAVALARTAAFFSNDQAPLSTRTVRYISGIHFPQGVSNAESAPLYGIENTNRGCGFNTPYLPGQSFVTPTRFHGTSPGLGPQTGKADLLDSQPFAVNPGGMPIFVGGRLAGGIGVVANPGTVGYEGMVEYAAVLATVVNGFGAEIPYPYQVVVGGVTLPFVEQTMKPVGVPDGVANGTYSFGPTQSSGLVPEGDLIAERGSTIGGLTLAQVKTIVQNAVATGAQTRAAIRLPVGSRARFVISVADLDGSLLALYRMPDATVFSIDVAVAKARNVVYFSGTPNPTDLPEVPAGTAVTNRTIGFAAQPLYPEGIDGTPPGPFFPLFLNDVAHPCTQGSQASTGNQNGIVFFPGSSPLYVGGKLVGGLGVSGDGVDQDDYATAGGAVGFEAPAGVRADNYYVRGVRLTYQKFPANPTQ